MTSQGSLHGQFQRAVERGNLLQALTLAKELPPLPLEDSFALLLLLAKKDPDRFRYAAPRWHARFVLEAKQLNLAESQLALGAVEVLPDELSRSAVAVIEGLAGRRGLRLGRIAFP